MLQEYISTSEYKMFIFTLFLTIRTTFGQECFDDGSEFCIDQEDILSADLLPGSFLFMDQYQKENNLQISENMSIDGTFDKALDEMDFHRKRMNKYLCHGFLAETILRNVGPPRIKRRFDVSSTGSLEDFLGDSNVTVHEKLLSDEGSSKYKTWLQRTTTLDDIYRHYAPRKKTTKKQGFQRQDNDDINEFGGETTGYVVEAPLPSGQMESHFVGPTEDHLSSPSSGYDLRHSDYYGHYDDFYPMIQEEHHYDLPNHQEGNHYEYHHKPVYHYEKGFGHELTLKDFFEIALTALAFLTFGLFVIQLLMNITNVTTASSASIVQDFGTRYKRQASILSSSSYSGNEELNELSHRVMRSIEAALVAEQDSGNCLRRALCEDNKYSREVKDDRRIWIPVWSLGMSWISGRMLNEAPWSAMLDSVKSSVLGLGGADCASLFSECNLKRERIKRRRRRRK